MYEVLHERMCVYDIYVYVYITYIYAHIYKYTYGGASISRLLKSIGLFCRISSVLQGSFAKETYNFKEPTHRSHPIASKPIKLRHNVQSLPTPNPICMREVVNRYDVYVIYKYMHANRLRNHLYV